MTRHSSPCVFRVTPTCVYLKDGTKIVASYWERTLTQPVKPFLEVVPQSVIKAQEPLGLHSWIKKYGHWVCSKCGFVRRTDGKNKPCPGVVKITTRVKQLPKGWVEEAMKEANKEKELNNFRKPISLPKDWCKGIPPSMRDEEWARQVKALIRKRELNQCKNHKPKRYPEVDRFIRKKRKMEKEQKKWAGIQHDPISREVIRKVHSRPPWAFVGRDNDWERQRKGK